MKERVKELRKELGLTMEKFGERLGVKKNTVSQWESGTNALSDQMLKAICNVNWNGKYVNEEWLRGNSEELFKADTGNELKALAEKYQMSETEYAFLKKYFELDSAQREVFFKTLDKVFSVVHDNEKSTEQTTLAGDTSTDPKIEKNTAGTSSGVAETEAAYEKNLGFAPSMESSALNTIGDTASTNNKANEENITENGGGESCNDVG